MAAVGFVEEVGPGPQNLAAAILHSAEPAHRLTWHPSLFPG